MIERAEICKVAELSCPLHQAKAFGAVIAKSADLQRLWIGERSPYGFAGPIGNQQTVIVMYGGAKIGKPVAIGLVELEH